MQARPSGDHRRGLWRALRRGLGQEPRERRRHGAAERAPKAARAWKKRLAGAGRGGKIGVRERRASAIVAAHVGDVDAGPHALIIVLLARRRACRLRAPALDRLAPDPPPKPAAPADGSLAARSRRPRRRRPQPREAASSTSCSTSCSRGPPCIISRIRDGVLCAEDVPVPAIAAEVGTPFYCYSTATLTRHYRVFDEAFAGLDHLICYSLKANSNQAVIATLARLGAGADVVSEGELRRALAAGIPPEKIVFSGVGKTRARVRPRPRGRHPLLQRGIGAGARAASRRSRLHAARRAASAFASTPTSTPGRTRRSRPGARRTSSASPSTRAREVYAPAAAPAGHSASSASTRISAARSPIFSPSTTPSA